MSALPLWRANRGHSTIDLNAICDGVATVPGITLVRGSLSEIDWVGNPVSVAQSALVPLEQVTELTAQWTERKTLAA
jgi:hypothetical protein